MSLLRSPSAVVKRFLKNHFYPSEVFENQIPYIKPVFGFTKPKLIY